jgi:pilus assembly protein CpaE
MPPTSKNSRVAAICEAGATQQQVTAALSAQPEFTLVDVLENTDKLVRRLRSSEPDIIIIDHTLAGEPTLDIIDDLALQFPQAAVVAILATSDPIMAQRVMLAGARGFVVQPFTQINLLSVLRRMVELETRRQPLKSASVFSLPEPIRPLRSLAVFSPRGGAGTTTLAINLAVALAEETGSKVLLFEGKLFFGHLEVMLNIRTQNNIADLLQHATHLDESLIRDVITEHASGIHVLLAPSNIQIAQGVRADDLYNVYVALSKMYDYIVIDNGSSLSESSVTLMDAVDRIVLVTNPDLAALHDTSRFMQLSRSLGYPPEKILTVLNRSGVDGGVRQADIESVLHYQLYALIAEDSEAALRSLNRGIPMLVRYPRSPASRAIREMTKNMLDITLSDTSREAAMAERTGRESMLASSQLG